MTSVDNEISKVDELFEKIGDTRNILIGNGFSLSHPTLKHCFEWNMEEAFACSNIIPNQSKGCPEKDLKQIRINAAKKILNYYLRKLQNKLGVESGNLGEITSMYYSKDKAHFNCSKFLEKFLQNSCSIFTLNYDPLLYFEILRFDKNRYCDGFRGNKFITQSSIEGYAGNSERARIFYLHGSWFVCANSEDELKKLSFDQESKDNINSIFSENERPFLILEDRTKIKKALIDGHEYLSFCYNQLENISGNLLVFGCSFENDDHILQAITKAMNKNKLREVFITYIDRGEIKDQKSQMEIIKDKMKVIPENKFTFDGEKPNVIFLKIPKNLIWKPSN